MAVLARLRITFQTTDDRFASGADDGSGKGAALLFGSVAFEAVRGHRPKPDA